LANLIAGETLRVLLVSARETARDEVGEALTNRAGDYRLYWVSQPDLAVLRGQDLVPHVILVDDDLAGANPVSLITQMAPRLQSAAILVMVGSDGMTLARQAVLAGARGFVEKPLQADQLMAALRQVLAQRKPASALTSQEESANGRIVVFCAPKGGTGRTTMALNTSISLQQAGKGNVVLVDADYAAPALDVALSLQSYRNIGDLLAKMSSLDREAISGVLATHASGIRVLLAPPPGDLSSPISLPQVQQVLVWLKRMFPWVIVDLGLPMDETAFAFLDGADRIIMSVLPEMVGLRNTRLMLDQMHDRGYPEDKVWLILNRATMTGGVPVRDIEERLHVTVKYRIPDDQPLATHSVNRGVPLIMSHRGSAVARAYIGLAQEMLNDTHVEALPEAADTGLFGRLRRGPKPTSA
jgi:pilus assembly protein CpaE